MADIEALAKELKEALGGIPGSDATARRKRRQALEDLVQEKKGIALTKLNNSQIKQAVKLAKLKDGVDKETITNLQKLNNRLDELGTKIRDAADVTLGFGKALYKGEGTISSYTETFAGKFGILGDTIAGTGRLLDTNIEMFRQLSQTGANFGQSIIRLRTAAAASALPLDDFASLVGENSRVLAALSGSATQGAEYIAGLGNALRTEAIPQLSTLGFTVDEINETLLLDLDRQRRMGILNRGATNFNIDSAIRFGKQLDRLAKLTGIQRDELRQQIESQQSNSKFAAFLQGQTKDTADRLQSFAGVIGEVAPGLNEGMQDLIANAGRPVTESAIQLIQNIPEAQGVIQDLISGQISTETALTRMRDASTKSIDRFRSATVTGQVEFLALQGDVINLGRRLVDVQAVLGEVAPELADDLTKGLTQFEDASKRMGSATQSLETAFLSMIGTFVGDAAGGFSTGLTSLSKTLLGLPPMMAATMYGTLKIMQGGIALLKDTGPTFAAVYAGTLAGNKGLGKMWGQTKGSFGGTMGKGMGLGKGGIGSKMIRGGGLLGAGLGAVGAVGNLADDDKSNNAGAYGTLAGTAIGLMLGGPVGAMVGGMVGQFAGDKFFGGKKQFGGPMTGGMPHLVGEAGPELVTTGTSSTVTSNTDLAKLFNTQALETKMTSMVTELNSANKTLTNMVLGVNTLVAVSNKTRVATEKNARMDRNQIGLV
jgi:DNA-binding transcriptional MerR regulator